jgi:hypothetical protein
VSCWINKPRFVRGLSFLGRTTPPGTRAPLTKPIYREHGIEPIKAGSSFHEGDNNVEYLGVFTLMKL